MADYKPFFMVAIDTKESSLGGILWNENYYPY